MNHRTSMDRGILVPVAIGILSIVGIGLLSLIAYFEKPEAAPSPSPTITPFKYTFLATETHTASAEVNPITLTAITIGEASTIASPALAGTPNDESSPEGNTTPATTNTPAIDLNLVFIEGKYDDIDERIVYEGSWVNEIIESAYGGTAFISTTTGDTATFTFLGTQLQIGYLADPTFGTVVVSMDGIEYPLDQSDGSAWLSPELQFGERSVILTHASGELIIFDYIVILGSP